ncbi:hypothetical protein N9Y25_04390, partial [Candidatus Pelagibacter bacterium]
MNVNQLENKGYTVININSDIIDCLKKDILKILFKKILNKNVSIKNNNLNKNFIELNKHINSLNQSTFLKKFGDVSLRYCSFKTGNIFNKWIKKEVKKKLKHKYYSLPYPMKYQLKENKNLKKNQHCIYFRCVRSNKKDVGNIHRDIDFWNIEKPIIPNSVKNFNKVYKIWIPVFGCNSKNSLKVLENSQNYNFDIKYKKNKFLKPIIKKKEANKFKKITPIKQFN